MRIGKKMLSFRRVWVRIFVFVPHWRVPKVRGRGHIRKLCVRRGRRRRRSGRFGRGTCNRNGTFSLARPSNVTGPDMTTVHSCQLGFCVSRFPQSPMTRRHTNDARKIDVQTGGNEFWFSATIISTKSEKQKTQILKGLSLHRRPTTSKTIDPRSCCCAYYLRHHGNRVLLVHVRIGQ